MPPQPDPRQRLRGLARQAQQRDRAWPSGPSFEVLDQLRDTVKARFPEHMRDEYGVDLSDEEQARAVFATLEWLAATVTNAQRQGSADPLGVVIQGLVAASQATAPTITGENT